MDRNEMKNSFLLCLTKEEIVDKYLDLREEYLKERDKIIMAIETIHYYSLYDEETGNIYYNKEELSLLELLEGDKNDE